MWFILFDSGKSLTSACGGGLGVECICLFEPGACPSPAAWRVQHFADELGLRSGALFELQIELEPLSAPDVDGHFLDAQESRGQEAESPQGPGCRGAQGSQGCQGCQGCQGGQGGLACQGCGVLWVRGVRLGCEGQRCGV
eukprot:CAMPEP_0184330660 /NCGR_PEP_ID=MMETSP1049-20130417/144802_1 /TAXON_ID=77928 /ORGANISM="Proteomonas sulcata, Strain CCMP704" /LENGTH=139 /DNA_ID=CAMNT_0026653109 /DNA_START=917 /DNA_END=1337 /DNA_ORIENTATION=-